MLRLWIAFLYVVLSGFVHQGVADSGPVRSENVEATLISEVDGVQPGTPFWVGVKLVHDPHWHTYWVNPADSGLETTIDWTLPPGFEAGEIQWPYPERLQMGPVVTFGFERPVLLMVHITPPAVMEDTHITLAARVDWLECKEICLPGGASLSLTLPVSQDAPPLAEEWMEAFTLARSEWPLRDIGWTFTGAREGARYMITASPPDWLADHVIERAAFFALEPERVEYEPEQHWRQEDGRYVFELNQDQSFGQVAERLTGVLVSPDGWRGPGSEQALFVDVEMGSAGVARLSGDPEIGGLAVALLFAFLGGIILNLMPCVFPVLSIKIMGFVRQAEEEHSTIWKHGAVFALGVLVSFWVLAGALIALRAGGEQLGWGFHLQAPWFLIGMSALFFLLGLNLFGVFEVGTSWMGLGQSASGTTSWTGSFFSGALATVIATPCTAPFMGAALGYALTLSAVEALLVFTFLGAGMASPYVLLSAYPKWLSKIPKPGPWMETLKQAMGWLLVATVVWLAWVLNVMAGGDAVIILIGVLFVIGVGAWILGHWGALYRPFPTRLTAKLLAAALIFGGLYSGVTATNQLEPARERGGGAVGGMNWESFTPERLAGLRAEGRPVFINFTAAWCLSCQVNERVAFSSARVQEQFREKGVVALKADWTNRDNVIGEVLAGYGRNSVPFYVLYGQGPDAQKQTLPELLTPAIVLEALDAI